MDENNEKINESAGSPAYSSSYKTVKEIKDTKNKNNFSFGKSIALPFIFSVIGTSAVIGTCFGIPSVKEKIIGTNIPNVISEESINANQDINTNLISLSNYSDTGVAVAQKILPSVVGIKVEYSVNSIFHYGGSSTATAEGSGVIISEDGYILTNNHIVNTSSSSSFYEVSNANKVVVYLYNDKTEYEGKIIGTDEQTDLAVIKIEKTGLKAAELGDSDSIRVGEYTMAVGNPLGMQSSVSTGSVSAVNREVTSDGKKFVLIQTDAAINSGNSGGALVNSKGQVIGINTLKLSGTGIEGMGFAIPINSTKEIYSQLIQYNKVKRPYIGISGRDLDESLAKANNLVVGIYVVSVEAFSPAEKAGLKIGDVIIKADEKVVTTMDELNQIKNSHKIGDTIKLVINRDGTEKEVNITLAEQ